MNFIPRRLSYLLFILLISAGSFAQSVSINEIVSSNQSVNTDEDDNYEDWIELYNYGSTSVNLSGFGLTDDPKSPFKWVFPNVSIGAGEFLLIWASDKNRIIPGSPLHTNFKISASGEPIVLTKPDSTQLDRVDLIAIPANTSYGRQPDGTGSLKIFATPTPKASNVGFTGIVDAPAFSHPAGLYKSSFDLALSHSDPNVTIVYTTDGSEPDIKNLSGTSYSYKNQYKLELSDALGILLYNTYTSKTYTSPINIYDRSSEADKLAKMNTRQHILVAPAQPVRKGIVVKAKAYFDTIASKTVSNTYFVWPEGNPFKIPVISLKIQEDYLFDYNKGTYTAGIDFDTWREQNPSNNQWYRPEFANYWRSGKAWEYPMHLEIFEPSGFTSVINKSGGYRIHGNNSRALAIKSLRLYARDEGNFEMNLFDEKVTDATKPDNKEFKRIMLRGEGTGGAVYYDVVFNRLMQPFFSGVTRIKPAIHFINGEYWGITAMRDRFDEYHYAYNFGLNEDNIVAVDCGGNNCELDAGEQADYDDYLAMRNYIINNDMAIAANFKRADSMLCMESFVDHMVLEIFAANDSYERTYWKVRNKENDGYGDGRWRLNIQDFEASFKTNIDWLSHWANTSNSANEALFGHLIKNTGFRNQFITRFSDLLNTGFKAERFIAIVDTTLAEVAPYLTEDANRVQRDNFYRNSERLNLINWANNRPAIQRDTINSFFGLAGMFNLNLNVSAKSAGYIKVNTVNINESTPGVSKNPYPWTGIYYKQIPVVLKAVAHKGYIFSHWSGDASGTTDSIVVNATADLNVTANYVIDSTHRSATYFWMIDNKVANDVPLENLSSTFAVKGMATLQYTSCLTGYPFDKDHANWRKASMERRNAPTEINYRAAANHDLSFASSNMRGIQIKQPMHKGGLENILTFNIPTTKMKNVKLSFAAESDGAANALIIEYWNGEKWDTTNMAKATFTLGSSYSLFEADFSNVLISRNNDMFKTRIRFAGNDMEADSGKRVHFNNVAVDAEDDDLTSLSKTPNQRTNQLLAYPNPAQTSIVLQSDEEIKEIVITNLYGQVVKTVHSDSRENMIDLTDLAPSLYMVKVQWKNQEKVIRVVKQ